eukprot:2955103-Pleurochrysis_carterae.AAC.1
MATHTAASSESAASAKERRLHRALEGERLVSGNGVPVQRENESEERFQERCGPVARSSGKVPMVRSLRPEN